MTTPMAALAAALVKAQAAVQSAKRDGTNSERPGDPYSYASADELITVGKAAMAPHGLAILPMRYTVTEDKNGVDLVREISLVHESGQAWVWVERWPIPAGKPRDKALASARTSMLGYVYRDVLGIPRVMHGEEPMDARRESPPAVPALARASVLTEKAEREARPRSARRVARATAAFVGATLPTAPGLELGDEDREREAREDAKAREVDALAAQDEPQADPDWLTDKAGPDTSGRVGAPEGRPTADGPAALNPAPAGDEEAIPPALPSLAGAYPDTPLPGERAGGGESAGADGPHPPDVPLVPAGGAELLGLTDTTTNEDWK